MDLVLKIAWRNILRHKGKSLVVGVILFVGAFLLTMGNGFLSGMNSGLSRNFIMRFSGNLVICPTNQPGDNVLIGDFGKVPKVLSGYTNIRNLLSRSPDVADFTPICRGMAMALSEDGDPAMTMVFGVKFDDYQEMFHTNIRMIEGKPLKPLERGILVTSNSRRELYESTSYWLKPEAEALNTNHMTPETRSNLADMNVRTNIVIMGMDQEGLALDVRVPVKGIFQYSQFGSVWDRVSMMDVATFRECFNYITGADAAVVLDKVQKDLLSASDENLDNLFSDDNVTTAQSVSGGYDVSRLTARKKGAVEKGDIDAGEYNMVLVRLKPGISTKKAVNGLNKSFRKLGMGFKAVSWEIAAKRAAQMAATIRLVLYFFVGILYLVAVIIITNTLTMAAMERTTEIGMMRAVGARKRFIQDMFTVETAILSFFFGGLGVLSGVGLTGILALFKFRATNQWLEMLFGGNVFSPLFTVGDIIGIVVSLTIATALSLIYPVVVARRITPLEAIARD